MSDELRRVVDDMRASADYSRAHGEYAAERFLRDYADRIEHALTGADSLVGAATTTDGSQ